MKQYNMAGMTIAVSNCMFVLLIKFAAIVFWTYIMSLMCRDGNSALAWLLLLLPFVVAFMAMAALSRKR